MLPPTSISRWGIDKLDIVVDKFFVTPLAIAFGELLLCDNALNTPANGQICATSFPRELKSISQKELFQDGSKQNALISCTRHAYKPDLH